MTSIQAINSAPAFTSAQRRPNESYYTGTKVGAAYAATGTTLSIGMLALSKKMIKFAADLVKSNIKDGSMTKEDAYKTLKPMFDAKRGLKGYKPLKPLLIGAAVMTGIGALVDFMNNMQRKTSEPNAKTSKGNEYTKVDMGKKSGAFLGAAYTLTSLALQAKRFKAMNFKAMNKIGMVAIASVGGYILGSIADRMANKKAAKAADAA